MRYEKGKEETRGPSEVGGGGGGSKDLDSGSVNKRSDELASVLKQAILSARFHKRQALSFFRFLLLRASTHKT